MGNLGFLQTVSVAPFGSNAPLWSLANEFWYYLLLPLGLQVVVRAQSLIARFTVLTLIIAIAFLLLAGMLSYGVIWLFGVAAFLALENPAASRLASSFGVGLGARTVLAAALAASRAQLLTGGDSIIGAAFAAALPWLERARASSPGYRKLGFVLSETSYTLYLVHFPLMAWICFTFVAPGQWAFDAMSVATATVILAVVMVYAGAIWWLFERNTGRVRSFLTRIAAGLLSTAKAGKIEQFQRNARR